MYKIFKSKFCFFKVLYYKLTFNFDDGTVLATARGTGNPADVHSTIGDLSVNDPEHVPYLLDTRTHRSQVLAPFHLQIWLSAGNATHFGHRAL